MKKTQNFWKAVLSFLERLWRGCGQQRNLPCARVWGPDSGTSRESSRVNILASIIAVAKFRREKSSISSTPQNTGVCRLKCLQLPNARGQTPKSTPRRPELLPQLEGHACHSNTRSPKFQGCSWSHASVDQARQAAIGAAEAKSAPWRSGITQVACVPPLCCPGRSKPQGGKGSGQQSNLEAISFRPPCTN